MTKQHEKPEQFSYQQMDGFITSRILSDAHLLEHGAETRNGLLDPTEQQKIDAYNLPSTQAGHLALHTTVEATSTDTGNTLVLHNAVEAASIDVEDMYEDFEARSSYLDSIYKITERYDAVFMHKVPARSADDRTIFGKLKDYVKIKPWSTERKLQRTTAKYEFDGSYEPHGTVNTLSEIKMSISNIGEWYSKSRAPIGMRLGYNVGTLSELELEIRFRDDAVAPLDDLQHESTGELYNFLHDYSFRSQGGKFTVKFGADEISISGKQSSALITGAPIDGFVYVYDHDRDIFQMNNGSTSHYPTTIPAQEFLGIISDTMSLIPVDDAAK